MQVSVFSRANSDGKTICLEELCLCQLVVLAHVSFSVLADGVGEDVVHQILPDTEWFV